VEAPRLQLGGGERLAEPAPQLRVVERVGEAVDEREVVGGGEVLAP